MRALMTANGIAMGLTDKGKTQIDVKVDSYLCHYMANFDENPVPHLEINKCKNRDDLR